MSKKKPMTEEAVKRIKEAEKRKGQPNGPGTFPKRAEEAAERNKKK